MTYVGHLLVTAVRGYQLVVRPLLPPACRFEPSCSEYYRLCLENHGVLRATGLAVRRLVRCHPWHAGGYDPPPGRLQQHGPNA